MRTRPLRPTIADVARRAGVSRAAVSFAINGRPGVAEETRARILRAVEELGWRPSGSARALFRAQTGAIGLVLVRHADRLEFDDSFVRFLAGVERTLTARDYALLLQVLSPDAGAGLDAYRRLANSRRIDGMLVTDVLVEDPRFGLLAESGLRPRSPSGRSATAVPDPGDPARRGHGQGDRAPDRARASIGGVHRRRPQLRVRRDPPDRLDEHPSPRRARARPLSLTHPRGHRRPSRHGAGSAGRRPNNRDRLHERHARARRRGRGPQARLDVPRDVSITGFDDSPSRPSARRR